MPRADTKTALLDTAQRFVQEKGFNAFSYKDLAEEVGIRTASIHYHFPAKFDLARALMVRYIAGLEEALRAIEEEVESPRERLEAFVALYRATQERDAICLCGSLAADLETLPPEVASEVSAYLVRSETWIERTLRDGVGSGDFRQDLDPTQAAAGLISGLQGALILSRGRSGIDPLTSVAEAFFGGIGA